MAIDPSGTSRRPTEPKPSPAATPAAPPAPKAAQPSNVVRPAPVAADGFKPTTATAPAPMALPQQPAPLAAPRSSADALREAEAFLKGPPNQTDSEVRDNASVVSDANDVNDAADTNPGSARFQTAKSQVDQNRGLEQARLDALPADQRAKYEQVRAVTQAANDPVAELSLQTLLLQGSLPGGKDLTGAGTTLDQLARLSSPGTPLASGLDRGQLVTDVLQELAVPSAIAQHGKNTCGPTMASIYVAHECPAEYVRLVTGLASPEGKVQLVNGSSLQRVANTVADDGSQRSNSQRLLEPALMDYANGPLGYDNAKDVHTAGPLPTVPGAAPGMIDHLLGGIFGHDFKSVNMIVAGQHEAVDGIAQYTAKGKPMPTMIEYGDGLAHLHWVMVTGVHRDPSGNEVVSFINPWGREETMPRGDFEKKLKGAAWDANAANRKPWDPLLGWKASVLG